MPGEDGAEVAEELVQHGLRGGGTEVADVEVGLPHVGARRPRVAHLKGQIFAQG